MKQNNTFHYRLKQLVHDHLHMVKQCYTWWNSVLSNMSVTKHPAMQCTCSFFVSYLWEIWHPCQSVWRLKHVWIKLLSNDEALCDLDSLLSLRLACRLVIKRHCSFSSHPTGVHLLLKRVCCVKSSVSGLLWDIMLFMTWQTPLLTSLQSDRSCQSGV